MTNKKQQAAPLTQAQIYKALATWNNLNDVCRNATEENCALLTAAEKAGKARTAFLLRIHSRVNKIRADRERDELKAVAK